MNYKSIPDNRKNGKTKLEQTHLVLLRLLQLFDSICQENNLRYWLDAGTLLGAVRHKGFIPWDDDIDVMMPWEDYNKFLKLPPDSFPFDVFLQTADTDIDYICPWAKLRDRFSFIDEEGGPYKYSQAIFIDIFPAVYITENQSKFRWLYGYFEPFNIKKEKIVKHLAFKSKVRIIVKNFFLNIILQVLKKSFFETKLLNYFNKGIRKWEYLTPIRYYQKFENNIIFPLKKIRFENCDFFAPHDTHKYLTIYFGDYMELPPIEERNTTHNIIDIKPFGPNPHFSGLKWSDYYENH